MLRILTLVALGCALPAAALAAPSASIDPTGAIRVDGLDAGQAARLSVHVDGADAGAPPIAGRVERTATGVRFVPRYPLAAGHRFTVTGYGGPPLHASTPARIAPPPRVIGFAPAVEALPANTLRLYVRFATPMRRDDATAHVALLDGAGRPIDQPFFVADGELWSDDGTRLTLLFDPGRVKTGLAAHDRLGRALAPGGALRLVVRATMPDAHGRPLGQRFERRWAVASADLDPPDPDRWRFVAPQAGTRQPAVIALDAPVDAVLLGERVDILGADGAVVPGRVDVAPAGDRWAFVPDVPWRAGAYRWRVDARLEDHAGNALDGLFDRPAHVAPRRLEGGIYTRRFTL